MLAVVPVFGGALGYPLLHGWDDNVYVTNNAARLGFNLHNLAWWFTHDCVSCYLPLTMISYMADYAVWGLRAFGYHLQNLLWHAVAVLALFACFRRLGLRRPVALALSWLYAVQPQRIESVVWISERKDVLCAAFFFLALHAWLRAREHKRPPWAAFVFFLCAMLSKSMAITLPAVLLILDFHLEFLSDCRPRTIEGRALRSWGVRVLRRQWPFWAVSLSFVPVTIAFQSVPRDETTLIRQCLVAVHNLFWYAGRLFVPLNLCPIYPKIQFTGPRLASLALLCLGLALAIALAWWRWRQDSAAILPYFLCYAVALAPVSGLVPLGYVDMSDRYSYIPSAFLLLAAGLAYQRWWQRLSSRSAGIASRVAMAAILALGCVFSLQSRRYARLWRDIGDLTRFACQRRPANVFALGQLGDIDLDRGRLDEALIIGGRLAAADRTWMTPAARQRALRRGLYLEGFALYGLGHRVEALAAFEAIAPTLDKVMYHEPTRNAAILAMMADCYLERGEREKALACYDAILARAPRGSFEEAFYRGLRAVHAGQYASAAKAFEQALARRPGHPVAKANLAECRRRLARKPGPAPDPPAPDSRGPAAGP